MSGPGNDDEFILEDSEPAALGSAKTSGRGSDRTESAAPTRSGRSRPVILDRVASFFAGIGRSLASIRVVSGFLDAFRGFSESMRGLLGSRGNLNVRLAVLSGSVLLLIIVLSLLLVALGRALSAPGPSPSTPIQLSTSGLAGIARGNQGLSQAQASQGAGAAGSQGVSNAPAPSPLSLPQDPFLQSPLLPPERELFLKGEIGYDRQARKSWSLNDVRGVWKTLDDLYKSALRKQNSEAFRRMMAEP